MLPTFTTSVPDSIQQPHDDYPVLTSKNLKLWPDESGICKVGGTTAQPTWETMTAVAFEDGHFKNITAGMNIYSNQSQLILLDMAQKISYLELQKPEICATTFKVVTDVERPQDNFTFLMAGRDHKIDERMHINFHAIHTINGPPTDTPGGIKWAAPFAKYFKKSELAHDFNLKDLDALDAWMLSNKEYDTERFETRMAKLRDAAELRMRKVAKHQAKRGKSHKIDKAVEAKFINEMMPAIEEEFVAYTTLAASMNMPFCVRHMAIAYSDSDISSFMSNGSLSTERCLEIINGLVDTVFKYSAPLSEDVRAELEADPDIINKLLGGTYLEPKASPALALATDSLDDSINMQVDEMMAAGQVTGAAIRTFSGASVR